MNGRKTIGLLLAVCGLVLGSLTLSHSMYYAPEDTGYIRVAGTSITEAKTIERIKEQNVPTTPPPPHWPSKLEIPALAIETHVQKVGINSKGNMGTPTNFKDVAWYANGTVPGEQGSAVIDGHVDNGLGFAGVFKHLEDLKIGDDIYVTENGGRKLHFVVYDKGLYETKDAPADLIFGRADGSYLNLITCTGDWLSEAKTYSKRLVIFAKASP